MDSLLLYFAIYFRDSHYDFKKVRECILPAKNKPYFFLMLEKYFIHNTKVSNVCLSMSLEYIN